MSRRTAVVGALVALAALDVLLVAWATRPPSPSDAAESAARPPAARSTPATPSETPSTMPPTAGGSPAGDVRLMLGTGAGGAALRAVAGACDGERATLEVSNDSGATWSAVDVPAASLLRVNADTPREAWAVGTDRSCTPRFLRTADGGQTWETSAATAGAWHLLPSPADKLHAPQRTVDSPCDTSGPIDLAGIDPLRGAVLCPNGRVRVTDDGGDSWRKAGTIPGATTLNYPDADTAFVARPGAANCAGTAILGSTDAGKTWDKRGCVDEATGSVAIAFSSATKGLLVTQDQAWRTKDGGKTWKLLG